jgi:hypothetical protein
MTAEEELIQSYFDAFNSHDIEGVMACFDENPVLVDATGTRFEGPGGETALRDRVCTDARLSLRPSYSDRTLGPGRSGVTLPWHPSPIWKSHRSDRCRSSGHRGRANQEIRDYHRPLPAKAA